MFILKQVSWDTKVKSFPKTAELLCELNVAMLISMMSEKRMLCAEYHAHMQQASLEREKAQYSEPVNS